jgi:hypothetical protein
LTAPADGACECCTKFRAHRSAKRCLHQRRGDRV